MSDSDVSSTDTTDEGEGVTASTDTSNAGQEPGSVEELPNWAQEQLSKVRNEAAKHRTEKRELKQQLEQALESAGKVTSLQEQVRVKDDSLSDVSAELGKLRAVLNAGVSGDQAVDIASRVKGATAEEWDADAQNLASLFGESSAPKHERRPDPSQGAGNSVPLNGDPILNGIKSKLGL